MRSGRRPALARTRFGMQGCQLAEFAALGQVVRLFEIHAIPPLRAGLINPPQLLKGVGERAALRNSCRTGLLAVNVFARLGRQDRKHRMPPVARGDEQGIDVLARP
jgi:hypothetical protein